METRSKKVQMEENTERDMPSSLSPPRGGEDSHHVVNDEDSQQPDSDEASEPPSRPPSPSEYPVFAAEDEVPEERDPVLELDSK